MGIRTKDDEQNFYICGQCSSKIYHLKSEEAPDVCPDCGWEHKALEKYAVPNTIKLDLNQY